MLASHAQAPIYGGAAVWQRARAIKKVPGMDAPVASTDGFVKLYAHPHAGAEAGDGANKLDHPTVHLGTTQAAATRMAGGTCVSGGTDALEMHQRGGSEAVARR